MEDRAVWSGQLAVDKGPHKPAEWDISRITTFCLYFDSVACLHRPDSLLDAGGSKPSSADRVVRELAEAGVLRGGWPDPETKSGQIQQAADGTLAWAAEQQESLRNLDTTATRGRTQRVAISAAKMTGINFASELNDMGIHASFEYASPLSQSEGIENCIVVQDEVANRLALSIGVAAAGADEAALLMTSDQMQQLASDAERMSIINVDTTGDAQLGLDFGTKPGRVNRNESDSFDVLQVMLSGGLIPTIRHDVDDAAQTILRLRNDHGQDLKNFRSRIANEVDLLHAEVAGLSERDAEGLILDRASDLKKSAALISRDLEESGIPHHLINVGRGLLSEAAFGLATHGTIPPGGQVALIGAWATAEWAMLKRPVAAIKNSKLRPETQGLRFLARVNSDGSFR